MLILPLTHKYIRTCPACVISMAADTTFINVLVLVWSLIMELLHGSVGNFFNESMSLLETNSVMVSSNGCFAKLVLISFLLLATAFMTALLSISKTRNVRLHAGTVQTRSRTRNGVQCTGAPCASSLSHMKTQERTYESLCYDVMVWQTVRTSDEHVQVMCA